MPLLTTPAQHDRSTTSRDQAGQRGELPAEVAGLRHARLGRGARRRHHLVGDHVATLDIASYLGLVIFYRDFTHAVFRGLALKIRRQFFKPALLAILGAQLKLFAGRLTTIKQLDGDGGRAQLVGVVGIVPDLLY